MRSDFAEAYDRHVLDVYAFIAYRVGSAEDAEDLTQLTFERALRAWSRFDERRATLGTWLVAIARNALIDHYRRDRSGREQRLDLKHEERMATAVAGPEQSLGPAPALAAALDGLTEREREVLALRFGADLRGPEIAGLLELTLANVQQILSRALRKLRAELAEAASAQRGTSSQAAKGPAPNTPNPANASRAAPTDA